MLQKVFYRAGLCLKRNSATILTCVGAVGVVATAVTAVKATPKVIKIIEKAEKEKGEKLTKFETFKIAAPAYIPSTAICLGTLACIFGANVLNKRQQAALASAYALANSTYKDYRKKLKELYGDEADSEIRAAIAKDKYLAEPPEIHAMGFRQLDGLENVADTGDLVLFYEYFSNRYFESTFMEVQAAEYHLNRNFALRGFATVNEFYEFLGIPQTESGVVLGWDMGDGYGWVDFQHEKAVLDDNLDCYIISYEFTPDTLADY